MTTAAPSRHAQGTEYEAVIGLEVHSQVLTKSKMFCGCSSDYVNSPPNTHTCPVCLGMPGVLPVINRAAVEATVMTALALNCTISPFSKFDRKNYPYPGLMKGYQISQYDLPLSRNGWLEIEVDGQRRRAGITRVHLEEDTAKLSHKNDGTEDYSLVDVNRAGTQLMEIVGEPDLRSPEEARQYLVKLHAILQYIGVSTANMEDGAFRCDANVSVRPKGSTSYGAKVEVKNMNSFRSVFRALEYEVKRQSEALRKGERIAQETRGWVETKGVTVSQRSKEHAHDYRYFPEPDLPPMRVSVEWIEELRARLSELPDARRDRFEREYGLPHYDADLLTASKAMADFFEAAVKSSPDRQKRAKAAGNWMLGEFSRLLNAASIEAQQATSMPPDAAASLALHVFKQTKLTSQGLAALLDLLDNGTIGGPAAKAVFEEMFKTGKAPDQVVKEQGLTQISDTLALEAAADQAIAANPQAVQDYVKGKETAIKFLVGQVMKATRGRAEPNLVTDILKRKLQQKAGG